MGHGDHGTAIQKNLQDLVVVLVGGQDEWGDLRGEGGGVAVSLLPRLLSVGSSEERGGEREEETGRWGDVEGEGMRKRGNFVSDGKVERISKGSLVSYKEEYL